MAERRTAVELLRELNQLEEHERIEAKSARKDVGKSVLETVCALSNEPGLDGGWILLGVCEEELALFPTYEAVGVEQPEKVAADLASQCADQFNRPIRPDIVTSSIAGKTVLAVYVPEVPPHDKPVYFKAQGLPRGAFRRVGNTDQRCTEDDLIGLYGARQLESFDAGVVSDADRADLSNEAIAEYRHARGEANADAEELNWSDDELLRALGCMKPGDGGILRPTVAGMALFGTGPALRRCFPTHRVDYVRVPGREWVPDPTKRFETVEIRDSLFRLIRRAQAAILDDLPRGFELAEGELQRTDRPRIPQRVLREALVNALMHRSYRHHGPVQILRYANRLEIRNPGFSLKSRSHLGEPGSTPRNPVIAAVLHETRFAETKGSGIRVMRAMVEEAGLAPPVFESDRSRDEFVVRFFFHHFLGDEDLRWLASFKSLQLTESETRALVFVRHEGAIDNATYRDLNKVDSLQASGSLRRLRDAGLLRQQGRGTATRYEPTDLLIADPPDRNAPALSGNPGALSGNPGALSGNPGGLSGNPQADSDEGTEARGRLVADLPDELAERIRGLGRRQAPEDVKDLIVALCSETSWRAEDLAVLLDRNVNYVRDNYLRPLVKDERLAMTNPSIPNDPQQAYRARVAAGQ